MKPIKNFIYSTILFFFGLLSIAQIPDKPNPPKLYNNLSKAYPDFLTPSEAEKLENKLQKFSRETSNQIAIVIIDDLGGYTAAEYATLLGQKWGIGKKDKNNGIVILVKPTGKKGERELFIAVGLGLEGAIPDLATKKIRENIIQPLFAKGKYYQGLNEGTNALMKLAKGEISEKDLPSGNSNSIDTFIVIIIVFIMLILIFSKNNKSVIYTSGRRNYPSTGYYGSYWGGGGSSYGNSNSGGWSGFGGGSFGGGGSGGKW